MPIVHDFIALDSSIIELRPSKYGFRIGENLSLYMEMPIVGKPRTDCTESIGVESSQVHELD